MMGYYLLKILITAVFVYLLLADKNNNQIEAALIVLHSLIDIYLSAEWVRIKTETAKDNRNKQYTNWCKEYDI